MSHFTVLVTNTHEKSIDEQLERFYEQGDESDYFMEKVIDAEHGKYDEYIREDVKNWTERAELNRTKDDQERADTCQGYADEAQAALDGDDEAKLAYITKEEGREPDENGDFYHISNPDAKWDWYQVGGRWSGYFKKKPGADGELGRQSLVMPVETDDTVADVIKVKDIDWEAMDAEERENHGKFYDEWHTAEKKPFVWDDKQVNDLKTLSREDYVNRPVSHATFAVLHDDVWYEKGEMGWWAIVSNEKDQADWDTEFRKLIESLDPEAEVTVVDCHI